MTEFDIKKVKAFDTFRLKDGRIFEFRYISEPTYGFVFGLVNGKDAYLTSDTYNCAIFMQNNKPQR